MSFKITRGDTGPNMDLTIRSAGAAQSIVGATCVLQFRKSSSSTITTKSLAIISGAAGTVRATWTAVETAALVEGAYAAWVVVTFADLSILTFPDGDNGFTFFVVDPAT